MPQANYPSDDDKKKDKVPEVTLEEVLKRPSLDISKCKIGEHVLVESNTGALFSLTIIDPAKRLVEVTGTEPRFKEKQRAMYEAAWLTKDGGLVVDGKIIKDMRMVLRYANTRYISACVSSALIEGSGWRYDVIEA